MTIKEVNESFGIEITADGETRTRVFIMSYDDWINQGGDSVRSGDGDTLFIDLPLIGDEYEDQYGDYRPDLKVTHISRTNTDGLNMCQVTITYSTTAPEEQIDQPDDTASWSEVLNVSVNHQSVDKYVNTSGKLIDWRKTWAAISASSFTPAVAPTEEGAPELTLPVPSATYSITCTSTSRYIKRMLDNLGKVNSVDLLTAVNAQRQSVRDVDTDVNAYDDTDKWLFVGGTMNSSGGKNYTYTFNFEYDPDTWDVHYEQTLGKYESANFYTELLSDMDGLDTKTWQAGTRA